MKHLKTPNKSVWIHRVCCFSFVALFVSLFVWKAAVSAQITTHEIQVTDSTASETRPTLGHDGITSIVVYYSRTVSSGGFGDGTVKYRRLSDTGVLGTSATTVSLGLGTSDKLNDISGDYIVYTAFSTSDTTIGQVKVYSISTGTTQNVGSPAVIHEARLHGDKVVWIEGGTDDTNVFLFDIDDIGKLGVTPTHIAGPLPPIAGDPTSGVEIGSELVVWEERDQTTRLRDIHYYDLTDTSVSCVACDPDMDESQPATSGPWVTWSEAQLGMIGKRIRARNVRTDVVIDVVANGSTNQSPSIHGDLIAYDGRASAAFSEIFLYQISTDATFQLTDDGVDQLLSNLFDDRVAYVDRRNGNNDIFVTVFNLLDIDGDEVDNSTDNCPIIFNPLQEDRDLIPLSWNVDYSGDSLPDQDSTAWSKEDLYPWGTEEVTGSGQLHTGSDGSSPVFSRYVMYDPGLSNIGTTMEAHLKVQSQDPLWNSPLRIFDGIYHVRLDIYHDRIVIPDNMFDDSRGSVVHSMDTRDFHTYRVTTFYDPVNGGTVEVFVDGIKVIEESGLPDSSWLEPTYLNRSVAFGNINDCVSTCTTLGSGDTYWDWIRYYTGTPNNQGDGIGDACDLDIDGDGIFNEVDTDPYIFSYDFNDFGLGGTTYGTITDRGDQILTVRDSTEPPPDDDGVTITADPSGGALTATVEACQGTADTTIEHLGANEEVTVTCSSSTVTVNSGAVEVTFTAYEGTPAHVSLSEGNSLTFDPTALTVTASPDNTETVIIIVEGTSISILPGATVSLNLDQDDDGYNSDVDCDDNNPAVNPGASETCNGIDDNCDGQVDEVYVFGGFQQPINTDGSSIFKAGRTIPVKVTLADCSGINVSTATVTITVNKISAAVLGTEEELDVESSGSANTGNMFRYDDTEGLYIFNLSTKGYTAGTYRVYAQPDDGSSYSVMFSLK